MAERDPAVIGARIARRRHQLDMTQIELAEALGVSPSTVANWERGVSYPARKMGKIEQLLGSISEPQSAASEDDDLERLEAQAAGLLETARQMRADRERRNPRRNGSDEPRSQRDAG